MQVSWPPLPFCSLRAAGSAVPQGVVFCDRVDRDGSPAAVHGAPAVAVRHEQPQEPLRGGSPPQTATASSAPVHQVQNEQPQSSLRTDRAPQAHGVLHGPALGESLHKIFFCELGFAERVREYAEVDEASSSTRGLRATVSVSCEL